MFIKSWDGQRAVNLNRVTQIYYKSTTRFSEYFRRLVPIDLCKEIPPQDLLRYVLIADNIIIGFVNSEDEARQWVNNILTAYNNRRI